MLNTHMHWRIQAAEERVRNELDPLLPVPSPLIRPKEDVLMQSSARKRHVSQGRLRKSEQRSHHKNALLYHHVNAMTVSQ